MTTSAAPLRVLLVEDSTAQARFVQQILDVDAEPRGFDVDWVERLADGLDRLAAGPVDLVLLDLVLPDSAGLDTFTSVRTAYPHLPIVVLSGAGDQDAALKAVAGGAQDYLAKNTMSPETLLRSIRYALERHRAMTELRRLALCDELTGIYNRRGFVNVAEQHLAAARRTSQLLTAVFVDVDGLKAINDTHGHRHGDQALVDVAALMVDTFSYGAVVGRIGGDEFCALLDTTNAPDAGARLRSAIERRAAAADRPYSLSCSVGVITRPADGCSVAELMAAADQAMYDQRHTLSSAGTSPSHPGPAKRPPVTSADARPTDHPNYESEPA